MPLPSALPPGDLKTVTIFTDGACPGNPGPGGWAAILVYGEHRRELTGGVRRTTNNRMELTAAIRALEALKEPCSVTLVSDSMYVINGIAKGWARSWRAKRWIRAARTIRKGEELTYDYNTDGEGLIKCRCRPDCQRFL